MKPSLKAIFLLNIALLSGCSMLGGKTGLSVASSLREGQTRTEVIEILSRGATSIDEKTRLCPLGKTWDDIIEMKPVLTALKGSERETNMAVHKYIEISRTWGFMGFDIFHLFFSESDTLMGYTQQHIN